MHARFTSVFICAPSVATDSTSRSLASVNGEVAVGHLEDDQRHGGGVIFADVAGPRAGGAILFGDQLIARQDKSTGKWSGDFSDDYATAMALIILQMPNRYLPVYTGKGPGS